MTLKLLANNALTLIALCMAQSVSSIRAVVGMQGLSTRCVSEGMRERSHATSRLGCWPPSPGAGPTRASAGRRRLRMFM